MNPKQQHQSSWRSNIGRLGLILVILLALRSCLDNTNNYQALSDDSARLNGAAQRQNHNLAKRFAPILHLHPDEQFYPIDPHIFIQHSRLKGPGLKTGHTPTTSITSQILNQYKEVGRDGKRWHRHPTRAGFSQEHCVYLDLSDQFHKGEHHKLKSVPVYYYIENTANKDLNELNISYWYFFAFNQASTLVSLGDHEGDWESVRIVIKNQQVHSVIVNQHGQAQVLPRSSVSLTDEHVELWIAKGTHATYANFEQSLRARLIDSLSRGGRQWQTEFNLKSIRSAPWRDYAGAWGDSAKLFGTIQTHTPAPIGPWFQQGQLSAVKVDDAK